MAYCFQFYDKDRIAPWRAEQNAQQGRGVKWGVLDVSQERVAAVDVGIPQGQATTQQFAGLVRAAGIGLHVKVAGPERAPGIRTGREYGPEKEEA